MNNCWKEPPQNKKHKFSLYTYWVGLFASIIFFSFFEYQNFKASTQKLKTTISTSKDDTCCLDYTICNTPIIIKREPIKDSTEEKPCCTETQKCEKK